MPSTTWENLSFTGRRPLIVCVFVVMIILLGFGVVELGIFLSKRNLALAWSGFTTSVADKVGSVREFAKPKTKPETVAVIPVPPRPVLMPTAAILNPNNFTGHHVVVRDSATGQMLFGKAAYDPWPLASVTKLLSALVLLETPLDFSATTTAATGDLFDTDVAPGATYHIEDLWNAALISSSNRAVVSMVYASGLTEEQFVQRMNDKVRQLGMTGTTIVEPTGLNPHNNSTAADIAVLVAEAMKKPKILETVKKSSYSLAAVDGSFAKRVKTTDSLLAGTVGKSNFELIGGKTGYIPESGYNFAMESTSSTNRIVVVVLGATSTEARFTEARRAAEWAFQSFIWK